MKKICSFLALAGWALLAPAAEDFSDAFDVSQQNKVTLFSPVHPAGFSANDIFGASESFFNGETGRTIFDDVAPADGIDYVEFETPYYVKLQGYNLEVFGDPGGGRYTTSFSLKWFNETNGSWVLADQFTPHPIPELTPIPVAGPWGSNVCQRTLPTVIFSKRWRAEFVRDMTVRRTGPRIVELDAISIPNAEAPTVELTSPAPGFELTLPGDVLFKASANDPDGILKVEFVANGALVGEATPDSGFEAVWNNPQPGEYTVYARAIDRMGGTTETLPIPIKINGAPSIPIQISELTILNQQVQFKALNVVPQQEAKIQVSEDLVIWSDYQTFTPSEDTYTFIDSEPSSSKDRQFYRVVQGTGGGEPPPPPPQ